MDYGRLFRLDGKVAVVIGAGSGIGQASARALAAHGAVVVAADLRPEAARATAAMIADDGGQAEAQPVDVVREDDVRRLFDGRRSPGHGALDVVVTTPAINVRKPVLAYTRRRDWTGCSR